MIRFFLGVVVALLLAPYSMKLGEYLKTAVELDQTFWSNLCFIEKNIHLFSAIIPTLLLFGSIYIPVYIFVNARMNQSVRQNKNEDELIKCKNALLKAKEQLLKKNSELAESEAHNRELLDALILEKSRNSQKIVDITEYRQRYAPKSKN